MQLNEEGELSDTNKNTLMRELDLLCELWNCALREYYYNNELNVTYDILKVIFFQMARKKNALLAGEKKLAKKASSSLIASWNKLLSRVLIYL